MFLVKEKCSEPSLDITVYVGGKGSGVLREILSYNEENKDEWKVAGNMKEARENLAVGLVSSTCNKPGMN